MIRARRTVNAGSRASPAAAAERAASFWPRRASALASMNCGKGKLLFASIDRRNQITAASSSSKQSLAKPASIAQIDKLLSRGESSDTFLDMLLGFVGAANDDLGTGKYASLSMGQIPVKCQGAFGFSDGLQSTIGVKIN